MARLTLDENGAKRRFKLNPGKLTIGSGDAATLKLTSPNVAELHAELVFEAGVARLRPRPGVLPPTLGGKPMSVETILVGGQVVKIGAAAIAVDYDEGEGPRASKGAGAGSTRRGEAPGGAGPKGNASSGRTEARGRRAAADAGQGDGTPRVTRQRIQAKKGMPTWAILLIVAVLGLLAFQFGGTLLSSATSADFNPVGSQIRFEDYLRDADTIGARKALAEFEGQKLSEDWRKRYDEMKARLDSIGSVASQASVDQEATRYWQNQLSNYADNYLAGSASRPKARVFVKRLRAFKADYPTHEKREWVDRMLSRYESIALLTEPATLADLQWEVNTLTAAKPRRYREAFAFIDEFLGRASGSDRDEALKLKAELESGQQEFFDGEVEGAAIYYSPVKYPTKFDAMKSIEILVQLVIGMADPALADNAASRLVKMPEITVLEGYKRDRRKTFDALIENSIIRKKAQELGLLDG